MVLSDDVNYSLYDDKTVRAFAFAYRTVRFLLAQHENYKCFFFSSLFFERNIYGENEMGTENRFIDSLLIHFIYRLLPFVAVAAARTPRSFHFTNMKLIIFNLEIFEIRLLI